MEGADSSRDGRPLADGGVARHGEDELVVPDGVSWKGRWLALGSGLWQGRGPSAANSGVLQSVRDGPNVSTPRLMIKAAWPGRGRGGGY